MLVWVARVSAVGAWAVLAVAIGWGFGLGGGTRQPLTTLDTLARIGIALLWLRMAALWAAKAVRMWTRRKHRRVSLSKDARPLRSRVPLTFDAAPWVWVRVAAVLLLLPFAAALPAALSAMDGGEDVRAIKNAGAVLSTATVVGVTDAEAVEDSDGVVTHYDSDLELALPDGSRITARGADTAEEPRTDDRVQVLWAPSAPELGPLVRTTDLSPHVDTGTTIGGMRLFLLLFFGLFFVCFVLPLSVAAEADQLHDLAWRPLAQTAVPVLATFLFLWIRPLLTGVGIGGPESILPAVYGGFAIPLLFLYIGLALRALLD
ncbi:hypothetical protein SAMN05216371_0700 [Streptomyces sp. TLI_053]|uniref:hypothetical protein n=1 Tax=Streptomyces sp. TLI_053 TaxID=1855352 RepID=UPI00087D1B16|nr:hypothetical protein [Streptomyces sp. TLI_053]SDS82902.1 hypothetical protein SAMN05216371_0700 [Streptomyces sp. TLI_053]